VVTTINDNARKQLGRTKKPEAGSSVSQHKPTSKLHHPSHGDNRVRDQKKSNLIMLSWGDLGASFLVPAKNDSGHPQQSSAWLHKNQREEFYLFFDGFGRLSRATWKSQSGVQTSRMIDSGHADFYTGQRQGWKLEGCVWKLHVGGCEGPPCHVAEAVEGLRAL
jgi:hypothetical protein